MATEAERYKELHQRVVDALWNKGDLSAIDGHLSPKMKTEAQAQGVGPENLKAFVKDVRTAFPDLRVTIDHVVVEGNNLISFSTFRGTHTGAFRGAAATGQKFEMSAASHVTFGAGDAVTSQRVVYDQMGMLKQLGLRPEQFNFAPQATGQ